MDEIKPCPICGGDAKFRILSHGYNSTCTTATLVIECGKCKLQTPKTAELDISLSPNKEIGVTIVTDERHKLIEYWNNRDNK